MKKHNWTAIFSLNLTDEEAAKAYTYGLHENQVNFKIEKDDGFVEVGCLDCELSYRECFGKPCEGENYDPKEQ